jgi:hypothetical protein
MAMQAVATSASTCSAVAARSPDASTKARSVTFACASSVNFADAAPPLSSGHMAPPQFMLVAASATIESKVRVFMA